MVKTLKELGCKVDVSNKYGQKALFWIVSKCPEIVSARPVLFWLKPQVIPRLWSLFCFKSMQILDEYIEMNRYSRKQKFMLHHLDVQPNRMHQLLTILVARS